jgi:hypothetical protein
LRFRVSMVLASRRSLVPTLATTRVRCTLDRRVSGARLLRASAAPSVSRPAVRSMRGSRHWLTRASGRS